jgi:magnesium-transporting ATPase (P-type)
MSEMADQSLRVLALAYREVDESALPPVDQIDRAFTDREMTFIGLVGILDPPREETRGAVETCIGAGIQVHMLTGDHPSTARAIAREVAILSPEMDAKARADPSLRIIMTAPDFDALSDAEIDAMPHLPLVIARCSPITKVKMIQALHRRNKR